MNLNEKIPSLSIGNRNLKYLLSIIFSFFFFAPFLGLLYFGLKYDLGKDDSLAFFIILLLASFLIGYVLIRRVFDRIHRVYAEAGNLTKEIDGSNYNFFQNELQGILHSFQVINQKLYSSSEIIAKRGTQISTLKELSELCYLTFNNAELFQVTLEMAMKLTNADIGSVLLLEGKERKTFVVRASYGLGNIISIGDKMDFSTSIAKYAIINKTPLLVDDIENDKRFGRKNRPHYATKSFLCMPLKGMQDVFGVLTLSRKNENVPFTTDEVDVLTPLISNAAFTYENLNLSQKYHDSLKQLSIYSDILKILRYGLRKNELLQTIFSKLKELVPFDTAVFFEIRKEKTEDDAILEVIATIAADVYTNKAYHYAGSSVEEAVMQENILFINDTSRLKHPLDQKIFNMSSVKEAILAPLKISGKVIGVAVFGCKIPGTIGNYEKQIEDIASILSIAFEKNLIYSSLYKRHQEMELIKQIGGILASSTFYQQEVLKHTIEMIQTIINVEDCYLFLLEGEELKSKINYKLNQSVDMKDFDLIHIPLGKGIVGYTAASGESIIVQDVQRSRHFKPDFDLRPGINIRCVLCVPLISRGRVMGVIETLNKIAGDFDDNDLGLLQSIATSVSIALENSNLYQKTLSMAEHERGIRNIFQKFVPKEIVDRIIHNAEEGTQLLEELKTITFLNIDMRNFSNISKKMGPQRTVSILNRFFAEMGGIVFNHNGIVDKYLGDGFLALFGAPVASSMDAENAVKAAIEMKERLAAINNNLLADIGNTISIGISIHTGEAVVGNIGFDKKMDYTVIGDSVNAVFRLQDLTKSRPNSILISEKTLQAVVRPILDVRETGKCDLGSTLGELAIYELLGLKNPVEKDIRAGLPYQAGE